MVGDVALVGPDSGSNSSAAHRTWRLLPPAPLKRCGEGFWWPGLWLYAGVLRSWLRRADCLGVAQVHTSVAKEGAEMWPPGSHCGQGARSVLCPLSC